MSIVMSVFHYLFYILIQLFSLSLSVETLLFTATLSALAFSAKLMASMIS